MFFSILNFFQFVLATVGARGSMLNEWRRSLACTSSFNPSQGSSRSNDQQLSDMSKGGLEF